MICKRVPAEEVNIATPMAQMPMKKENPKMMREKRGGSCRQ
jgi:hypothetical protein